MSLSRIFVRHRAGVHACFNQHHVHQVPPRLAQNRIPRPERTLLLPCQRLHRPRYSCYELKGLPLCWHQDFWHQRRSYATPVEIKSWVSLGVITDGCLDTCRIELLKISTSLSILLPSSSPTGTIPVAILTTPREPWEKAQPLQSPKPDYTALDNGTGFIEDRRPTSNINPYVFDALLVDSTRLEKSQAGLMPLHLQQWPSWPTKNCSQAQSN